MAPRKGKRMLHKPSNRKPPHQTPALTCFLDLPLEIRLMVYKYAIGYYEVQWTMTQEFTSGFVLLRGDLHKVDSKRKKRLRPLSVLRVCRLVHQESLPIVYDRIRFDIIFKHVYQEDQERLRSHLRTRYHLQLTNGKSQPTHGITQVVLQRVKHICVSMNERIPAALLSRMHVLSTCLRHGKDLESLRFISSSRMASPDDIWSLASVLYFDSYKGAAVLEPLYDKLTERDIAEIKRFQKVAGRALSVGLMQQSR